MLEKHFILMSRDRLLGSRGKRGEIGQLLDVLFTALTLMGLVQHGHAVGIMCG